MAKKKFYECAHSGLLFPADYEKEWGRKYGHGLGPSPVSEVWNTEYETAPPPITQETQDIAQIMHPVVSCKATVHLVEVEESEAASRMAIPHHADPLGKRRAAIVREKQMKNSKRLRLMQSAWDTVNKPYAEEEA
jgi:hypothetical protein